MRLGDDKTGKWGFIDQKGTVVIEPQFDGVGQFSEGLASFSVGKGYDTSLYGFIDKTGKIVINPRYALVGKFSGGLVYGSVGDDKDKRRCGYLDRTGHFVISPTLITARDFAEGLALVNAAEDSNQSNRWGFIRGGTERAEQLAGGVGEANQSPLKTFIHYLELASWFVLLPLLLLLPLAWPRATRAFAGTCIYGLSWVEGVCLWLMCAISVQVLWGWVGFFIGVLLFGVGVVPLAIIATAANGIWSWSGAYLGWIVLVFGLRALGMWITAKSTIRT